MCWIFYSSGISSLQAFAHMLLDLGIFVSWITCTFVYFTDLSKSQEIRHTPRCDISHALLLQCFVSTHSDFHSLCPRATGKGGVGIAHQLPVLCVRTTVCTAMSFNCCTVSLHFPYYFMDMSGKLKNERADSSERKRKFSNLIETDMESLGMPKAMLPVPQRLAAPVCWRHPHVEEKNRIRECVKNVKDILSRIMSKGEV